MMLWVILTLMVTAVSLFLAAPFLRGGAGSDANAIGTGATVFHDQLAEVERDLADGVIDAAQADASRHEIKRRVLALQRDGDVSVRTLAEIERKAFAAAVAAVVAIGGTLIYALSGSPDIPAAPRSSAPTAIAPSAIGAAGQPAPTSSSAPAASAGLSSVDEMVERLAQRMAKSPNDADGWRMLGWSYFRMDRYQEAASAYAKASALQPEIGPLKTARAEALVRAADGKVTAEALLLSEEALKLDLKDPRARYFVGLAKEQAGDAKGALDVWLALLADATAADEWAGEVRQQTIDLAKASGIDVVARLPQSSTGPGILGKLNQNAANAAAVTPPAATPPHTAPSAMPVAREPTVDDVEAADAMSARDRDAMIHGMVDSLQSRLDANPRDVEGWIKLLRSRAVLGEPDKAKTSLMRALQVFSDAPAERERIIAAAREAGLSP